jgi:hypothetical protein
MMNVRTLGTALLGAAMLTGLETAWGSPASLDIGKPLPSFSATDLTGHAHTAQELGGKPTILIVVPGQDAESSSGAWARWAGARYGAAVRQVVIVALDLPFFVPEGVVRNSAKRKTPRDFWNDTWIDVRGGVQGALGIPGGGQEPYVYALDGAGNVKARVHGPLNASTGEAIGKVLPPTHEAMAP